MARPRKIKEEATEELNGVPMSEVQDVIKRLNSKKPAIAGFPVFITDPGSRVIKRIWSDSDLQMHLNRGWIRNG